MKLIYTFQKGKAEGDKSMAEVLGGKGANLAEMCNAGLPIPAGMTIPTEACVEYMKGDKKAKNALIFECVDKVLIALNTMAKDVGYVPLLSVRSGARVSMPGMMDTILNVGLTYETMDEWKDRLGERAALDSYRRLIQMFGNVVHGLPNELFEAKIEKIKSYKYDLDEPPKTDAEMGIKHLERVIEEFLLVYNEYVGKFPDNLNDQLQEAIAAVFDSWNSERAVKYRDAHNIPDDWGTAVNIQQMVFGNLNDVSGSGVLFSRNPGTGEAGVLYGEFLMNAQGEDVVAGTRTPIPLEEMIDAGDCWPDVYKQLAQIATDMEKHYGDMQDMEFTVEDGKLYILQTRSGKRSAAAAFRIAYDMVEEGMITKEEAIKRVNGKQYLVLQKPQIDPSFKVEPTFVGLPAAGNIATGVAVTDSAMAEKCKEKCILVADETTPEDFGGMNASVGILTRTGGATSHAAVVARGMDKTCVVGAGEMVIGVDVKDGDMVTIDGATGRVWINVEVPVIKMKIEDHVRKIIEWAMSGEAKNAVIKLTPDIGSNYEHWKDEFAEQLPKEGRVYIDCSKLVGKYERYMISDMLTVLKSRTGVSGIIGLNNDQKLNETDTKFLWFLGLDSGVKTVNEDETFDARFKSLILKKWTKTFKQDWTLHLPGCADKEQVGELQKCGWKMVRPVKNLGDLLDVDGILEISSEVEKRLKDEGVEIEKFVALLKDAGRSVEAMPKAVTRERMVFEVLGKSS